MSSQVKKSDQWQLRDKKHQYFSIVSLPTDSVIVDHAVTETVIVAHPVLHKNSNLLFIRTNQMIEMWLCIY
jgi:hypothetical protein